MICLKVLFQLTSGKAEENYKCFQLYYMVTKQKFEADTSKMKVLNVNTAQSVCTTNGQLTAHVTNCVRDLMYVAISEDETVRSPCTELRPCSINTLNILTWLNCGSSTDVDCSYTERSLSSFSDVISRTN